jgi:hypothetical protein
MKSSCSLSAPTANVFVYYAVRVVEEAYEIALLQGEGPILKGVWFKFPDSDVAVGVSVAPNLFVFCVVLVSTKESGWLVLADDVRGVIVAWIDKLACQ